MNISLAWLADYIALDDLAPDDIASRLTAAGLEVEGMELFETVRGNLAGVVVGKVLQVQPHPNADRLRLTQVDVGQPAPLAIVCGAPNVAEGQYVLVALPGSTIYPLNGEPLQLKETKIRGERSQGMICAEDELGLGTSHDGILVLADAPAPGTPAAEYLQLTADTVLEIGVTPNRTDALSHFGVARDLGAILDRPVRRPALRALHDNTPCPVAVSVQDPRQCPRYTGRVIQGVQVGPSPQWLQTRLKAIGQRPINNVVDVTNYVLHSLGQPLHAFDLAKVRGGRIEVRNVAAGTPFVTLDGVSRHLAGTDLLVCDAEGPMCLAGTMGGRDSGVTDSTTDIFLEAAVFAPGVVRAQARRLDLHSDSAYRFERGVDPNGTPEALHLATQLILEVAGGTATGALDLGSGEYPRAEIDFDYEAARRLIGKAIADDEMAAILQRLEVEVLPAGQPHRVRLRIPTYRQDVLRPQDVVEDIVRVYGLDNVAPAAALHARIDYRRRTDETALRNRIADLLADAGWMELLNNSLVPAAWADSSAVPLLNPLSEDLAVLRTQLLPSGLAAVAYNLARKADCLRLFEWGKTYHQYASGRQERWQLGLFLVGPTHGEHWQTKPSASDFFTLKGQLHHLLERLNLRGLVHSELAPDPEMAFGARVLVGDQELVRYGAVGGDWLRRFDIDQPVYAALLQYEVVAEAMTQRPALQYHEVPRLLPVRRDLSLLVPANVQYAQLRDVVAAVNPALVQQVDVVDVYDKLPDPAHVSYTLSLTILDRNKPLTDEAVDKLVQRVLGKLQSDLGVALRQ